MSLETLYPSSIQSCDYPQKQELPQYITKSKKSWEVDLSVIHNTSDQIIVEKILYDKSADIIKHFFRKVIAAQSYSKMFSHGFFFKNLGQALPKPSGKSSFNSLKHLDTISKNYLERIKAKTAELTYEEDILVSKVRSAKIILRHQTNSNLAKDGVLNIFSYEKLFNSNLLNTCNTNQLDKDTLSNHDFVFFGIEFSGDGIKHPLNTLHNSFFNGGNAYLLENQYPHGYLTLTDHFFNTVPTYDKHEHKEFNAQFPCAEYEISRFINSDNGTNDVPIFNVKDMKLAIGLHLVNFIRSSKDLNLKAFALNDNLTEKELDRLINFIFQLEFHVPRMISTTRFKEVRVREIDLESAIIASNMERIDELVKTKAEACKAMAIAVEYSKRDIIEKLLSDWRFSFTDISEVNFYNHDIEYSLSCQPKNTGILNIFLESKLIDVNKALCKYSEGDTMMDIAIEYDCKETITLLERYGAITGEELRKINDLSNVSMN